MADKKILNDENAEKVAGGRPDVTELMARDLTKKDEIIKAAASSQPYLAKSLPEDLLAKISGGDTQTYYEHCPRCGGVGSL